MKRYRILIVCSLILVAVSCTKLEQKWRGAIEQGQDIPVSDLLRSAYNGLNNPMMDQSRFWAAQEHTTDEAIGPTRGGDWDDNGVWRVLHAHTWNADHGFLRDTYRELLQAQYSASNVLQFSPSATQAAEARFLRAFTIFLVLDGWGQVPYREDLKDFKKFPKTLEGAEAVSFIISELNAILATLPDGPAYVANKDAARVLLMKTLLNKGAFLNKAAPTFDAADMNQVVTLADQIINSGKYSLANNFFDNFTWDNDVKSTENIFTLYNKDGDRGGNVRSRWFLGLHYNQNPSGWNGFTTLSDFYDKFEAADTRREQSYTGVTNVSGLKVGFLVGQQYNQNGVALTDRKNNPLAFTREVKLKETGANLEVTGIRVIKYPVDYTGGDQADNDYVVFRLADVMLMKAEAQLRGATGGAASALTIINQIRTKRGASSLAGPATLDILLDERGRELYWEGWRRQDLIRFGKFLGTWQEKTASDPKNLLFPIPSEQLAVNPNLKQNPGY
ncbi:MAG TPA: RagB/SusD family nutrient uptake outer membrane protein [Chitinophagaceae bacterium]